MTLLSILTSSKNQSFHTFIIEEKMVVGNLLGE